jgi:hypothetical protein
MLEHKRAGVLFSTKEFIGRSPNASNAVEQIDISEMFTFIRGALYRRKKAPMKGA